MQYVAFDIEVARTFDDSLERDGVEWDARLGITCAATMCSGDSSPRVWWDQNIVTGDPMPQMGENELQYLVQWLNHKVLEGYKIVTINGAGFDLRVLAAESGLHRICQRLAYGSIDIFFQILCLKGYSPGLKALSNSMSKVAKMEGMDGLQAVDLWMTDHEKVLKYVGLDAQSTLEVAEAISKEGAARWISKTGRHNRVDVPYLMTVGEALKVPAPDTSWMNKPWTRDRFVGWLTEFKADDAKREDARSDH